MGSGLIWRRLLSFLGRQLEAPLPPVVCGVESLARSSAAQGSHLGSQDTQPGLPWSQALQP